MLPTPCVSKATHTPAAAIRLRPATLRQHGRPRRHPGVTASSDGGMVLHVTTVLTRKRGVPTHGC
jgi:hypothetical protein